jgi:hypothetical protein
MPANIGELACHFVTADALRRKKEVAFEGR